MSNLSAEILNALTFTMVRSVVLTVGNVLRSDDGIGPYIASKLRSTRNVLIVDAGENPEDAIELITAFAPKRIVIIDAANFGATPGDIALIDRERIPETTISTHMVPMPVVAAILAKDTGADICYIGIQAANISFGDTISPLVKQSADIVINRIQQELAHA